MLYDNLLSGQKFYIEYGSNVTTNITSNDTEKRMLMENTNESFEVNSLSSEINSSFLNILQSK